jgi:hypothetical protein
MHILLLPVTLKHHWIAPFTWNGMTVWADEDVQMLCKCTTMLMLYVYCLSYLPGVNFSEIPSTVQLILSHWTAILTYIDIKQVKCILTSKCCKSNTLKPQPLCCYMAFILMGVNLETCISQAFQTRYTQPLNLKHTLFLCMPPLEFQGLLHIVAVISHTTWSETMVHGALGCCGYLI